MPVAGAEGSKHSPADQEFLDGVSNRQLMGFRNFMYTPVYIAANATQFLDHDWVDIPALKKYLRLDENASQDASSTRSIPVSDSVRVKIEAPAPVISVKAEPEACGLPETSPHVKTRTSQEGGHEVIELLSDSEPERSAADSDLEVLEALQRGMTKVVEVEVTSTSTTVIKFQWKSLLLLLRVPNFY
ncbi:hypothetical protein FB451DRAFT_1184196 [Mycena latifolia]|nr:hypothetical protein FB451DRAFT_1184196 [Mycena latifolia]